MRDPKNIFQSFKKEMKDKNPLIRNKDFWYLQAWTSSFLPICMQNINGEVTDCTDFKPSFSDQGLCFSRNADGIDKMYKKSKYIESFQQTMMFNMTPPLVKKNKGSGFRHQYSFLVDNGYYEDLKRGLFGDKHIYTSITSDTKIWKRLKSTHTNFLLAIHSPNTIADIGGNGIRIESGYETTIRVNLMELHSEDSIKHIAVDKRQCLFPDENQNYGLFLNYSKVNCEFECKLGEAEKRCACRPWDYPRPIKVSSNDTERPICDFFSSSCFHSAMKDEKVEKRCFDTCPSNCNEVKYTISSERVPLDPTKEICVESIERDETRSSKTIHASVWDHIFGESHYIHSSSNLYKYRWYKETPTQKLVRMFQGVMLNQTQTNVNYCTEKVMADIAIVNIVVNSPTVLKLVQDVRVTFTDKLANFGK